MKRILFLTFYFRPDLCAGSFRNSPLLDELSRQSKNKDIQIDVLTTVPNRYSTFSQDFDNIEEFDNVRIERIHIPAHKSGMKDQALSFRTYFFETLKKTKTKKYDLVYGSSSRFFTSYLAYRIAKKNNCPLYIDVRDIFSETISGISKNPVLKYLFPPFLAFFENRVYNYASHINLISEGFKENFSKYSSAAVSTYSHGVDPVFQNNPLNQRIINPTNRKKILYAGNVGEGQGLHKIIPDAANLLAETHEFEIIGDGGAMDKLASEIEDKKVQNVTLRNPMEREKLVGEYHKADILFIHLNNYEIFKKVLPSKIFELAVIGKPILAGVGGYSARFLREHVPHSFIFEPCSAESLVNSLRQMADSNHEQMDVQQFKEQFSRESINKCMSESILANLK